MYSAQTLRNGLRDIRDALAHMRTPWRPTSDEYISGHGFGSRPPVAPGIIDAEVALRRQLRVLYKDTVEEIPRFKVAPMHGYPRGIDTPAGIPIPYTRARRTQGAGYVVRPPRSIGELMRWLDMHAEFVVVSTTEYQIEYLLGQLLPAMQSLAGFTTQVDRTMGLLVAQVRARRAEGRTPDVYLSAHRCAKLSPVTVSRRTIARWADDGRVKSRVGSDGQREVSVVDVVTECERLASAEARTTSTGTMEDTDNG